MFLWDLAPLAAFILTWAAITLWRNLYREGFNRPRGALISIWSCSGPIARQLRCGGFRMSLSPMHESRILCLLLGIGKGRLCSYCHWDQPLWSYIQPIFLTPRSRVGSTSSWQNFIWCLLCWVFRNTGKFPLWGRLHRISNRWYWVLSRFCVHLFCRDPWWWSGRCSRWTPWPLPSGTPYCPSRSSLIFFIYFLKSKW